MIQLLQIVHLDGWNVIYIALIIVHLFGVNTTEDRLHHNIRFNTHICINNEIVSTHCQCLRIYVDVDVFS